MLTMVAVSAYAHEEPIVKTPFSDNPRSFLLIGNSFMYYNNSMHKPLLGIYYSIKDNTLKKQMRQHIYLEVLYIE